MSPIGLFSILYAPHLPALLADSGNQLFCVNNRFGCLNPELDENCPLRIFPASIT